MKRTKKCQHCSGCCNTQCHTITENTEDKLWEGLEKVFKTKDLRESPLFYFYFLGISINIFKKFKMCFDLLETYPYRMDGEVPMIILRVGFFEIFFENKLLYKFFYKRKHGITPKALCD